MIERVLLGQGLHCRGSFLKLRVITGFIPVIQSKTVRRQRWLALDCRNKSGNDTGGNGAGNNWGERRSFSDRTPAREVWPDA